MPAWIFGGEIVTHRWPESPGAGRIHHHGQTVLAQDTAAAGAHHAGNVLAAIATACSLGVPLGEGRAGDERLSQGMLARMSVHETARGADVPAR